MTAIQALYAVIAIFVAIVAIQGALSVRAQKRYTKLKSDTDHFMKLSVITTSALIKTAISQTRRNEEAKHRRAAIRMIDYMTDLLFPLIPKDRHEELYNKMTYYGTAENPFGRPRDTRFDMRDESGPSQAGTLTDLLNTLSGGRTATERKTGMSAALGAAYGTDRINSLLDQGFKLRSAGFSGPDMHVITWTPGDPVPDWLPAELKEIMAGLSAHAADPAPEQADPAERTADGADATPIHKTEPFAGEPMTATDPIAPGVRLDGGTTLSEGHEPEHGSNESFAPHGVGGSAPRRRQKQQAAEQGTE